MNKPLNKKETIIILVCAITIILSVVIFFVIRTINANSSSFKFNEHLKENVITITPAANQDSSTTLSCNVSLKELSYYILVCEANVNNTAYLYNPNNTNSYWNLYISNTFMKTIAKDTCMSMCQRDNIYYLEALKNNYSLNSEEEKLVLDEAAYIYENLTGKQVDATNLTMEDLYNIRYKISLASKYIKHLTDEDNYSTETLNVNGDYYTTICKTYTIDVDKVWDNVTLGNITIDR